mgnify:CR=1 FL=1
MLARVPRVRGAIRAASRGGPSPGSRVVMPAAFPSLPASWGEIICRGRGAYDVTGDLAARRIADGGNVRWLDPNGSDTANGLTEGTAKQTWAGVRATFALNTPVTVFIKPGTYSAWGAASVYQNANLIAVGGRARFSAAVTGLSWAANGTYPNVYQATVAAPYAVVDEAQLDAERIATWLTLQASLAAVDAAPGSYYASGGVLYVRTADSRAPDASLLVLPTGALNGVTLLDPSVFASGIDWIGGQRAFTAQAAAAFTAFDCRFLYGETGGYYANSCLDSVLVNCEAHGIVNGDGYDYTAVGKHLELRCRGRRNGAPWAASSGINNASSAHGATVVRLSGYYGNSDGPNVADAVSSYSFSAGCRIETSRDDSGPTQQCNVVADSSGGGAGAKIWLLDCGLGGAGIAADLRPSLAADRIYVRNSPYGRTPSGAGVVEAW